ncbi:hypothetical protein ACROYT_G024623 [Oculina patagonica]
MSYSKCGLCLKNLEVINPTTGIRYIRCEDWKQCPFFCREDSVHEYQQCLRDYVIPNYKVCEGGQSLYCRHMDVATLKVSRSQKNPLRPYFTCRRSKEMCRYFQWGDEMPFIDESQRLSPLYLPEEKKPIISVSIFNPDSITSVDKKIAQDLTLDDRIEVSASRDAFITLKDHKPDFVNNPTCRLINPTKSEIGIISKQILDNINKEIIKVTKVNQWRSTSNVIDWFKAIPSKSQHAFITFDVCDFYPSISEQLLTKALDYASKFTHITPQDRHIITHAKKSLLYHQNTPWEKRNSNNLFDVTMGSYDGAETCELVGLYMLSLITPKFKGQVGLYRDDGLAVCKATPKQIEKIKQEVCDIFKSNGLKITIEANKKTINFLDVTLDLTSGSYEPFMKPNNKIIYVHRHSNHPPALLKNIPENINKRLTSISSNQKVFDEAIPPYQKALDESGYNHKLTYNPQPKRNRNRQRKIVWYNPPWDANVKTNLGRKFLNIIDRCFPNGHPLHKIFNKHTLKLSYSCMPNMKSIISSHNKAVLSDYHQSQTTQTCNKECNCRKKDQCPLDGKCLSQNVVYQATVTTQTSSESYVGLASNFKDRYRNHTASFRHESKRNETELS